MPTELQTACTTESTMELPAAWPSTDPPASALVGSFGETHFGAAKLGDKRLTNRLVKVADAIVCHPGGSLPEKMHDPVALQALYYLMDCDAVTHASVLAPHRELTLRKMAAHAGKVLVLHDTTELDFTGHKSLRDTGQIGNGKRRGWLCHHAIVVSPQTREVLGLADQVLHARPKVRQGESVADKRARADRESRLWLTGTQGLPADPNIVDVCDRGADTFEFLEHELHSGRTFVVRSSRDRALLPGHTDGAERTRLYSYARSQPTLGQWTIAVPAAQTKKHTKHGPSRSTKTTLVQRQKRDAVLQVSAAPIRLCAPARKCGDHGTAPLPLWIVRVWESNPPEGIEPLEWFLLTNHPVTTFEQAKEVAEWYAIRWIIEEYHKAQKTGCRIEDPQFTSSQRLHPMIALLSVVALTLLNLRELSRRPDAQTRPATDVISSDYVSLLSTWRHHAEKPDWTIHDFCQALARLGGHQNRKHDHPPGWITLWKGWTALQTMLDGANALRRLRPRCA